MFYIKHGGDTSCSDQQSCSVITSFIYLYLDPGFGPIRVEDYDVNMKMECDFEIRVIL